MVQHLDGPKVDQLLAANGRWLVFLGQLLFGQLLFGRLLLGRLLFGNIHLGLGSRLRPEVQSCRCHDKGDNGRSGSYCPTSLR